MHAQDPIIYVESYVAMVHKSLFLYYFAHMFLGILMFLYTHLHKHLAYTFSYNPVII